MRSILFIIFILGTSNAAVCDLISNPCFFRERCNKLNGVFECSCPIGYSGDGFLGSTGCIDINECFSNTHNCELGETCTNSYGSYKCSCKNGYSWNTSSLSCDDIDECSKGRHTCDSSLCVNTNGSFLCDCVDTTKVVDTNGSCSLDKNECTFANGKYQKCEQLCVDVMNGYKCDCNVGYQLSQSNQFKCLDIDECVLGTHRCAQDGGICANTNGSYSCSCDENNGFSDMNLSSNEEHQCGNLNECQVNALSACGSFIANGAVENSLPPLTTSNVCCEDLPGGQGGKYSCYQALEASSNASSVQFVDIPFVNGNKVLQKDIFSNNSVISSTSSITGNETRGYETCSHNLVNFIEFLGFELQDIYFSYSSNSTTIVSECAALCKQDLSCSFFTVYPDVRRCKTLSALGMLNVNEDAQSASFIGCRESSELQGNLRRRVQTSNQEDQQYSLKLLSSNVLTGDQFVYLPSIIPLARLSQNKQQCRSNGGLTTIWMAEKEQKEWYATSTTTTTTSTTTTTTTTKTTTTTTTTINSYIVTSTTTLFIDYSNSTITTSGVDTAAKLIGDIVNASVTTFTGIGRAFINFFT